MENHQNQFVFVPYQKMDELFQKVDMLTEAILNNNQNRGSIDDF